MKFKLYLGGGVFELKSKTHKNQKHITNMMFKCSFSNNRPQKIFRKENLRQTNLIVGVRLLLADSRFKWNNYIGYTILHEHVCC
jgi:hypothetical protein